MAPGLDKYEALPLLHLMLGYSYYNSSCPVTLNIQITNELVELMCFNSLT